jgi:hypothetical protein
MPSDIEQAEHVLNNLRQKREVLVARGVELADERASIALAAHTGDSKASKRLLEINAALAVRASEVESIDAAIKAAGEKCAAAEQAEARKVAAAKAEELRKHVDELSEVPRFIDEHLAAALQGFIAFEHGITELNQKGIPHPSAAQLKLGICAVIQTWAQGLPKHIHNELRDGMSFLAPHERKTAVQYWKQIRTSIDRQIAQHLGNEGGGG